MRTDPAFGLIIPVDKPAGPTSHDVVAIARRALATRRVGHTGTLDPFASGLLVLCTGWATRLAEYLTGLPKTYTAVARLDGTTDTDDGTGARLQESSGWQRLDAPQIEASLAAMVGEQLQRPPAYSAKRVAGRRAYSLARQGEAPVLEPVSIHIHRLRLTEIALPEIHFEVDCSSGTYVRAIARDLGERLGTGGYLQELRRTRVGEVEVQTALQLDELNDAGKVELASLSPTRALPHLRSIELSGEECTRIRHGQPIARQVDAGDVMLTFEGELIGLARSDGSNLRPHKVVPTE